MEKKERIVGYCVILVGLVTLLALLFGLRRGILFPHHQIRVTFPSIGTLMQDDPVKSRGVEVGRVIKIEAVDQKAVATLEMYQYTELPVDTRFINYNYSMFGARMVIMVPGESKNFLDSKVIQEGDFIVGVTETIHRVEGLLKLVQTYRELTYNLAHGSDSTPSLQAIFNTKIYPALNEFGRFAEYLNTLETQTNRELDQLSRGTATLNSVSKTVKLNSDTLVVKANQSLEQLAILTNQSAEMVNLFESRLAAIQDTSHALNKLINNRDLYDQSVKLTQSIQEFLQSIRKQGFKDVIHFWRNVHLHLGKPNPK